MIYFDDLQGLFDDQYGLFDDSGIRSSTVLLEGAEGSGSVSSLLAIGSAISSIEGAQSSGFVSGLNAKAGAKGSVEGVSGSGEVENLTARILVFADIDGVEGSGQTSDLGGNGTAKANIVGVVATGYAGNVVAIGDAVQEQAGGGRRRRLKQGIPLVIIKDGKVSLGVAEGVGQAGKLNAFGVISINAKAKLKGVEADSNIAEVRAKGIQNLQDEELLMLLVA